MMHARFVYKPNARGVRKLIEGPQMGAFVDRRTKRIASGIRKIAPYFTGSFRKTIRARPARREGRRGWVGRVVTTDRFWHLEEYGSVNNAPHRTFAKATIAEGATFRDRR